MTTTSAGLSTSFWERAVPVVLRYQGHTGFVAEGAKASLTFAPNLRREAVAFDGVIQDPIKVREAMAMLHAVVVSDQRFRPKDRAAYRAYLERVAAEERALKDGFVVDATKELEAAHQARAQLGPDHDRARKRYWALRTKHERVLAREDPQLFRMLMPCDPIVTVAPDVVMFEGFAKDEASYGCVMIDRNAFSGAHAQHAQLGTTNVDYSLSLAGQMERLRTYRETRFGIDPKGIDVETDGAPAYREEKIDVPSTWLKGFGQLSSALMLPARRMQLPVEQIYAVLAQLKNHRERTGPRALRFLLEPGRAPTIVVEPWGVRIEGRATDAASRYDGDHSEQISIWGRRRIAALSRVLALAQLQRGTIEVALLGSGLPSVWSVDLGGVRAVLALSGWTTNDWSGGARLDLLAATATLDELLTERVAQHLQRERTARIDAIALALKAKPDAVRASVVRLAQLGQVVPDLVTGDVRFRMVIDAPLSAELLGDEPREVVDGKRIFQQRQVRLDRDEAAPGGKRFVHGHASAIECEAIFDRDGAMTRARCACSHFHRFGIRKGPCRHLLALRLFAMESVH